MTPEEMEICISTNFTKTTKPVATGIISVTNELRGYWPLTVRQVYYQLVAALIIPNNQGEYRKVSRIGTKLRELGALPWRAIEDRTRKTTGKRGRSNVEEYIKSQIDFFLEPRFYGRCYVQKQSVYVEVSTEKDALASIIEDETHNFCTRLNICKGQVSATMVEQIATRMDQAIMQDQRPVILHCGDLDPSGITIPKAIQKNLLNRHGIECDVRMIALTPSQVEKYDLPLAIDAIKPKDPNLKNWLEEYGPDQSPVELDALKPGVIKKIVRDALMDCYDMTEFEEEKKREIEDKQLLSDMRRNVIEYMFEAYPEYMRM